MITKIWAVWALACAVAAARPGELDKNFAPELRAWVAENLKITQPSMLALIAKPRGAFCEPHQL